MVCTDPVGGLCMGSTPICQRHACPHDPRVGVPPPGALPDSPARRRQGTWRRDIERGGTRTWRLVPGVPMPPFLRPLVFALSAHSTCAAILVACGFKPHISLLACKIGSPWDGAVSGDKERGLTSRCSGRRCWLERGQCMTPPYNNNTRARGPACGPPLPPLQVGPCLLPLTPPPPDVFADRVETPRAFMLFRTAWGNAQVQGACFEVYWFACFFTISSVVANLCCLIFDFSIGGAKIKINS